jgi:hypothetical protein
LVQSWRWYPVVEAIQALRGVQCIAAVTLIAELGDLSRFDNPRQLMSKYPPAKPEALVCEPLKAVNSGASQGGSYCFLKISNCSKRLSSASWC